MISLKHASVEFTDWGCWSRFPDGTGYGAHPHATPHYHVVAHRSGYGDDLLRYCREHEIIHHLAAEFFHDCASPVIWALAHGSESSSADAAYEEAMVMTCQRWVRAAERPIIGGVDWDAFRTIALATLETNG